MVTDYEVAYAERIIREKEDRKQFFIKLHAKLVALLLKYPERVYAVEVRNSIGSLCLQFSAENGTITEGFGWIDFYTFETQEKLTDKYKMACEFAKGTISFFPQERRS